MTAKYSVRASDLRAAGLSCYAARQLTSRPYPLPYIKKPSGPRGGNRVRLYRLDEILTRLRVHTGFSEEIAVKILAASAAKRKEVRRDN